MKKFIKPRARSKNLVVQELDSEFLIYDVNLHKAYCLNETSAKIWQACTGDNDVSEISSLIGKHFNSTVSEDFVWVALDQLKKENLIENKEEITADFGGMSRREVIRKVGLASVIALPIVSSIIAPLAVNAQSNTCINRACATNADCIAGCATCNVGAGICQ